jgi:hypothetical protein
VKSRRRKQEVNLTMVVMVILDGIGMEAITIVPATMELQEEIDHLLFALHVGNQDMLVGCVHSREIIIIMEMIVVQIDSSNDLSLFKPHNL